MPTYIWKCPKGHNLETVRLPKEQLICSECMPDFVPVRRDYRAEGAGFVGVADMRAQREGRQAGPELILPTAKDYERPDDPTGEKGMKTWMNEHEPRHDNKKPRWPTRSERTGV